MAPKRPSHLDEPPAISSSSDEEEASSEESSGSEDDKQDASDSDAKPKEETPPKTKKPRSKPSATPTRQSAKRTKKNPSEEASNADIDGTAASEDSKKMLFQRLWSEEDEIAILKGMIEYAVKNRMDPAVADMNAFHDFIKKSLHIDATKTQLSDKVRRLRKKYGNNLGKKKYNPTKPHELEAFELSKKIWGSEEPKSNGASKSNQKGKSELVSAPVEAERAEIDPKAGISVSLSGIIGFDKSLPEHVVKLGLALIPESKKAELEEKWKNLNIAELELFVKKSQLVSEQSKLILEAIKSSDH